MKPQYCQAANLVAVQEESEEALSGSPVSAVMMNSNDSSKSISAEIQNGCAQNPKHFPFPHAFPSVIYDGFSEHLIKDDAEMDEKTILEFANSAKINLSTTLHHYLQVIAGQDPGFSHKIWPGIVSFQPDPDFASWANTTETVFRSVEQVLQYQWANARDDTTMLDLTQILARASRERK